MFAHLTILDAVHPYFCKSPLFLYRPLYIQVFFYQRFVCFCASAYVISTHLIRQTRPVCVCACVCTRVCVSNFHMAQSVCRFIGWSVDLSVCHNFLSYTSMLLSEHLFLSLVDIHLFQSMTHIIKNSKQTRFMR